MKRAGILDTRIVLQRKSISQSTSGDTTETWTPLGTRWADYHPLTGNEVNIDAQWVAKEQVQFTVRWDKDIAALSPLDRIVCPAGDAGASPEVTRSIYDVLAVHSPDLNDTLKILTARRADVA